MASLYWLKTHLTLINVFQLYEYRVIGNSMPLENLQSGVSDAAITAKCLIFLLHQMNHLRYWLWNTTCLRTNKEWSFLDKVSTLLSAKLFIAHKNYCITLKQERLELLNAKVGTGQAKTENLNCTICLYLMEQKISRKPN